MPKMSAFGYKLKYVMYTCIKYKSLIGRGAHRDNLEINLYSLLAG